MTQLPNSLPNGEMHSFMLKHGEAGSKDGYESSYKNDASNDSPIVDYCLSGRQQPLLTIDGLASVSNSCATFHTITTPHVITTVAAVALTQNRSYSSPPQLDQDSSAIDYKFLTYHPRHRDSAMPSLRSINSDVFSLILGQLDPAASVCLALTSCYFYDSITALTNIKRLEELLRRRPSSIVRAALGHVYPTITVRRWNAALTVFHDPDNVFFRENLLRRLRVFNAPYLVLCAPLMGKAKVVPFAGGHRCIWCDGERKNMPQEAKAKFSEEEVWELWGEWPA